MAKIDRQPPGLPQTSVALWLPVAPHSALRPRVTQRGTYDPSATATAVLRMYVMREWRGRRAFAGPVAVDIDARLLRPSSSKRLWPCVRPDLDNYAKACLDAMNGLCFADDAQVVRLTAQKSYAVEPGWLVTIAVL